MPSEVKAQDTTSLASIKTVNEAATQSRTLLAEMQDAAQEAGTTLNGIYQDAANAQAAADTAQSSAESATASAEMAITQLSIVENVVGVLDLISKNGQYDLTQDTSVVPDKWYFTRQGEGTDQNPYVYTVVSNPTGDPSQEGWYELTGIDEAIQNYVSSHLIVDNSGLWLQKEGVDSRLQLHPSEGLLIHGSNGKILGKYGETAQIGDAEGFHIKMGVWYAKTEDTTVDPNKTYYILVGDNYEVVESPVTADIGNYYEQKTPELGFYEGENKVAYITNQQLYITQSVVLQQMDVGSPFSAGGLGQWSWKIHANVNGENNLYLKWLG